MKWFKVEYKNSGVLFGQNVFTKWVEAETEKQARDKVSFEGQGLRTILSVEQETK